MSTAIETYELSKRYRRASALTECTVTVPEGRVSALVGPNGAGKTTLLRILAGLTSPTCGRASVLDGAPRQDAAFLAEIGFLAQETPLYQRFTTQDHIQPRAIAPPATRITEPATGLLDGGPASTIEETRCT
jgi:ABC-2 type transport system ATP-binding protein